jgi:hypothetical protein
MLEILTETATVDHYTRCIDLQAGRLKLYCGFGTQDRVQCFKYEGGYAVVSENRAVGYAALHLFPASCLYGDPCHSSGYVFLQEEDYDAFRDGLQGEDDLAGIGKGLLDYLG